MAGAANGAAARLAPICNVNSCCCRSRRQIVKFDSLVANKWWQMPLLVSSSLNARVWHFCGSNPVKMTPIMYLPGPSEAGRRAQPGDCWINSMFDLRAGAAAEPSWPALQVICSHCTVKLALLCWPDCCKLPHTQKKYRISAVGWGGGTPAHDLYPRIRMDDLHKLKFASSEMD